MSERFTIRRACPDDALALERPAELDSKRLPAGRLLVAEVDGELWAAVSLDAAGEIADPFRRSGELVLLLHERARQLERAARPRRRRALRALAERLRGETESRVGEPA
jgi:hypothetical protein